jgi:2-oxoglutarate dehydrogenase E2 component (dihydrolipoamide succinyltransferase)
MALVELVMPRMGESVMEGTILHWLKKPGDKINADESVLEVATDKVDTEVPSPYGGILKQILAEKGQVVQVGHAIAIIETEGDSAVTTPTTVETPAPKPEVIATTPGPAVAANEKVNTPVISEKSSGSKFFSPLVLNIARQENITLPELDTISGTGKDGRVTKYDILDYVKKRSQTPATPNPSVADPVTTPVATDQPKVSEPAYVNKPATSASGNVEIIEMDRMRKMIAERMLDSKRIAPHVTSFVEADVTNIVYWRNRWKNDFMEREQAALTFTPIFIEAVVKAIKDYPLVNISVEGDRIIVKKDINIGMAVALPSGNLIVPVIKNADQLNIVGLTKKVNDLAKRARQNKLTADDVSGGTYTISNVGSFGNLMGTPIINQPQCGILALGAVIKKPAVIETPQGDTIGIRHMMFLSHSYDHRVIDGSLGGMFVRRVADYLENFDVNRKIFV